MTLRGLEFRSITVLIDRGAMTGNLATRTANGRQYKPTAYRAWEAYVYALALERALAERWEMPEYAASYVTLYNFRGDRENGVKVLNDCLQGVLYSNDSRLLDGPIRRIKDFGGPRVAVTIVALPPALWGMYRQPKERAPAPMPHQEWVSRQLVALYPDLVLNSDDNFNLCRR